jgi:hypothetical protein
MFRCLTLGLSLLLHGLASAAETRDLILVAGQSNAVGYDAYAEELPADPKDAATMFWWRVGDPPPDEFDGTSARRWTTLQFQPRTPAKPASRRQEARPPIRQLQPEDQGRVRTRDRDGPHAGDERVASARGHQDGLQRHVRRRRLERRTARSRPTPATAR